MRNFKLLIIGDANHQYILNFSKWIRTISPNIKISIISFHPIIDKTYTNNYFETTFEVLPNSAIINRIKGFRTIYLGFKLYCLIKKNKLRGDSILVHYVAPQIALFSFLFRKRTKNYLLAIWGSDFYRTTPEFYLRLNLKHADNIIIGSPQMIKDFQSKYPNYGSKIHLCYFGSEPIEKLKKLKELDTTKSQSCNLFNLTDNKINVTIGHNGSRSHQHLTILNELSNLSPTVAKKIRIILPMTYGLEKEYLEEIELLCVKCPFEYIIFNKFLNESEVANLRNLTDIMVNLQTTDAFSGSMREILFSGGIVITGSWLPYNFLKEMGIIYEEINSINEIKDKLMQVINHYDIIKKRCEGNGPLIYNISSWSHTIHKWKEVIELYR